MMRAAYRAGDTPREINEDNGVRVAHIWESTKDKNDIDLSISVSHVPYFCSYIFVYTYCIKFLSFFYRFLHFFQFPINIIAYLTLTNA